MCHKRCPSRTKLLFDIPERDCFKRREEMADSTSAKRWLPLEANPDVMNQVWSNFPSIFLFIYKIINNLRKCHLQFLWGLGVPPDEAECFDVYGLDEELLEMVPKPVLALLFLYPITSQVIWQRGIWLSVKSLLIRNFTYN